MYIIFSNYYFKKSDNMGFAVFLFAIGFFAFMIMIIYLLYKNMKKREISEIDKQKDTPLYNDQETPK